MRSKFMLAATSLLFFTSAAQADLTPWTDYEVSEAVYNVTTIKVDSNMGDAYLEGLRDTWVAGNKVSKELGQIEDWWIYRSDLPESGDFNLILVVKFADTEDLAPNKEAYEEFVEAFTQETLDRTTEFAQENYPAMRTITGQYQMREITLK